VVGSSSSAIGSDTLSPATTLGWPRSGRGSSSLALTLASDPRSATVVGTNSPLCSASPQRAERFATLKQMQVNFDASILQGALKLEFGLRNTRTRTRHYVSFALRSGPSFHRLNCA